MQPERIEKVKILVSSTLSRPPHERNSFLDAACGGDAVLRREVEYYLNNGEKTEQFFYRGETARLTNEFADAPTESFAGGIQTDPRVGKIFGKYIIQKRLAEGGMGIVYIALDTQLGREVALKVLPEFFSRDQERLQRFQREARAISLLNHPNIVTIFEIGHLEGCEFIVTEFVEGETLREKMSASRIPFVEMLKIASQVAGALAAAHKAGIIHRDIKPENVMLRPDGYVKVLDFGLAKMTDATRRSISGDVPVSQRSFNHTMPGTIMGTAAYMSPEQAEGGEVDARTDIWGLGVLLYEMVSGRLPFDGPTASHTIVAILEQAPDPIEHASPDVLRVIATALQKNKELRYQTAEATSAALDELKHKLGYVSDQNIPGTSTKPPTTAVRPSPYRKFLWLFPGAFGALLIGTVGIYALVTWLAAASRPETPEVPAVNSIVPVPTIKAEPTPTVSASTPTPTPSAIYADPTPDPTPTPEYVERQRTREKPRTQPLQTPRPVEVKKPVRKKKPGQDPNCVFTNSCH
ncbi:MAG: serine/threonine-protein kinase [Pyrinomonadaceae bacterium]